MKNILDIGEILIACLLIIAILLQKQGGGVSSLFGGSGGEEYHAKRGFEKFLFWGTIALVAIFTLLALSRIAFYK